VSIHKLDQEIKERFQSAIASLKSPDPDGYKGTAEREYQKELARILQKEGNKAANASTDQRIAGKLKAAGYDLGEIEKVIENYSPMAVKPTQEQHRFYAKTVVQKARIFKESNQAKRIGESRLIPLEKEANKIYGMPRSESFFIRPNFNLKDIQFAIANLMNTSVNSVLIYNSDDEEIPDLDNKISYLIDYSNAFGDFPVYLTIYPHLPAVEERFADDPERLAFISKFCALLSGEALVEIESDSEKIEEGWLLINGDGIKGEVLLDEERIIDDGSFVVSSIRPYLIS
jgi:hypothetical protein